MLKKIGLGLAGLIALFIVIGVIGAIAGGGDDEETSATTDVTETEAETTTEATEETTEEAEATTTSEVDPQEQAAAELTDRSQGLIADVDSALVDANQPNGLEYLPAAVRRAYRHLNGTLLADDAISVREMPAARRDVRVLARATADEQKLVISIKVAAAPKPILLSGSGSKVNTIRLRQRGPVIVSAQHSGSSNFIVELVGPGHDDLLVNEIGSYSGTVATDQEARRGRYRLPVEADGSWEISVEQPVPLGNEKPIGKPFSGRGSTVLRVRADSSMQPVVSARHSGQSNFIVYLIGYGDVSGSSLLFNEIGNYRGQILVDQEVPDGTYLVAIQGDGQWRIRFRR